MSEETLSGRQRELAEAAASAARLHRAAGDRTADRPATVGDLFGLPATSDFPVEWALLERGADGRFFAVPGDSHPFLGSRDVEVETSTGPLTLRCPAGLWLEPAAFDPALRTGTLEPDSLERARRKAREVARPDFVPDPFLEETDRSPEYEDWMRDVVLPARGAAGSVATLPTVRPPRRTARWMAAAAALFLLAALGFLLGSLRQSREIDRLAARVRSSEAALSAERGRREDDQQAATQALKERDRQAAELQVRISALEGRREAPQQPLLNLPVAILQPAEVLRGPAAKPYTIPDSAQFLTLVLRFRESEAYPAYRLIVTRDGSPEPVWRTDGLVRSPEGVQLALPRRYVPPGTYRLSLSGLRSGTAQPVAEYELTIAP